LSTSGRTSSTVSNSQASLSSLSSSIRSLLCYSNNSVLPFAFTPNEGWMERRQAHSLISVALARRDFRACETRTRPGATGTPLGAPPWRFSAGDPRCSLRQWDTGAAATARAKARMPGGRGSSPPAFAVSRRSRGTPLLAPPSGSSLEDAPHERGCESSSIETFRSQQKIRQVADDFGIGARISRCKPGDGFVQSFARSR
jgi:hypothetical protein